MDFDKLQVFIDGATDSGVVPTPSVIDRNISEIMTRRDVRQTLQEIRRMNCEVSYICEDLTNPSNLKAKIDAICKTMGSVTGVIHGAGNLADKNLEHKTENDYDLVYDTKVASLFSILQCIDVNALRYLILFSSISGYFGQVGQTDYSLSNEILNKFAHAVSKINKNIFVKSINWGQWDGGMVTPTYVSYTNLTLPTKSIE